MTFRQTVMRFINDAALASSINAIAFAELDGKLSYVNQAFVDMWKLRSAKDAIGRSLLEFWSKPEDAASVVAALQQRGSWQGELQALRHDGSLADLQVSAHLVKRDGGDPLCMMASFVDVTAHKSAERQLQQSNALLNSLIESMPAMVFVKRAGDLSFVKFNHAGEMLTGYAEQEMLGKNDRDFFPPEQADFFIASDREVLASHQLKDVPREPIRMRSGETRILHTRKVGIYDAAGEPTYLLGISMDITERVHAAEVLKRRKQVIDLSNDGFLITDVTGKILEVNAAYARISGYTVDELEKMHINQLEAKEQPDQIKAHIEKILANGSDRFETRHRHKDGHEIDLDVSTLYLPEMQQFAAFFCDISERKRAQLALLRNQDMLNEAERMGQLGSWELDMVSGELRWSDEVYRIFELDPAEFEPTYHNFLRVIHPDDQDMVNQAYMKSLEDKQPYDIEHRLRMASGRIKWVREHCFSEFDSLGKPLRSVGAVQDITGHKLTEESLRVAAVAFETHESIMITDANANIVRVNRAFEALTGYSAAEVMGRNPRLLSSGRQGKDFYVSMWRQLVKDKTWSGELWDRSKDGREYPKWLTITAVVNESGKTTGYVGIFSDITARKQAEEEIRKLAYYDALTKLPNRRLLLDHFQSALALSERSTYFGAVLFLDLDRFKTINDSLGHELGDMLLIDVALRIRACVREVDTVARLGGDEFVILVGEISADMQETLHKAALIAEKIRSALAQPYQINGNEYHSSASIGVCLYRGNDETTDDLLKHADLAMYQAKETGRNAVRFYDPLMQELVEKHAELESDLRRAVSGEQLLLHYQIQVDNENRPIGAEALVRWMHPTRGMVPPGEFIPIAEESSLILEVGDWVLDTACRQLASWGKNELTRGLILAVNVSGQQFRMHDFVERVSAAVRAHQIPPAQLKLELTESVVLSDVADVVTKMHALKAMGVKLSLDDFGTGYSSLSYLKRLPLDQLKIDQSFVRDSTSDLNDAVMVQTIIGLARNFRLNVIAEGVETDAQLAFLKQHGCMAYQGYLFSKPVPIEQFEALLGGW